MNSIVETLRVITTLNIPAFILNGMTIVKADAPEPVPIPFKLYKPVLTQIPDVLEVTNTYVKNPKLREYRNFNCPKPQQKIPNINVVVDPIYYNGGCKKYIYDELIRKCYNKEIAAIYLYARAHNKDISLKVIAQIYTSICFFLGVDPSRKHSESTKLFISYTFSNIFHSTTFLLYLDNEHSTETYKSRGIMQLTGLSNYQLATDILKNHINGKEFNLTNFVDHPEKLAELTIEAIFASVGVFVQLNTTWKEEHKKKLTLTNTLLAINSEDYKNMNSDEQSKKMVQNRVNIYMEVGVLLDLSVKVLKKHVGDESLVPSNFVLEFYIRKIATTFRNMLP